MTRTQRQQSSRLPALDGVRAAAALAVVTTHVAFQTASVARGPFGAVQGRLDCGVAVFFALSGFLLARPWVLGTPPTTARYFLRRAARILPAYWLAMVVAVVADSPQPNTIAAHVWLGQVYTGRLLDDFSQTWSLSAEVAFYAVLPFAAPVLARRSPIGRLRLLVGMAVIGLALTWLVRADGGIPGRAAFWMPVHLAWFAGGIGLAVATVPGAPRCMRLLTRCAQAPGTAWATAGVLLLFASTPLGGPLALLTPSPSAAVAKEALYAVIAVLVLAPCVVEAPEEARGLRAMLESPLAGWLGTISYGIFLWHLLVLRSAFALTSVKLFSGHELEIFLLTALGSVGVAALSWYCVERPILRWVHRGTAARPDRDVASAPA